MPEKDEIADAVVDRLGPRLTRIEDDLGVIRPFFQLTPGLEPLPVRVSHLERVTIKNISDIDEIRDAQEQERKALGTTRLQGRNAIYAIIVAALVSWAVGRFLPAPVPGPQGPQGQPGVRGPQGTPGSNGP